MSVVTGKNWAIYNGDVAEIAKTIAGERFDAVLCDPPYGLSFMGKRWDISVPSVELWREVFAVLRPGAPVLAFGGTRTYHRLAVAIEDAGFEIRDCIAWIYGSGFPKSLNVSKAIDKTNGDERPVVGAYKGASNIGKGSTNSYITSERGKQTDVIVTEAASAASAAWDGYGTALKPAFEPCLLARKPLDGTMVANVTAHGVGAINVDGTRIGWAGPEDAAAAATGFADSRARGTATQSQSIGRESRDGINRYNPDDLAGRWPANVTLDETSAALLDAQAGDRPGMSGGGNHAADYGGGMFGAIDCSHTARNDSGGPSRFFYVAKANRFEREFGCETLPFRSAGETVDREEGSAGQQSPSAGAGRTSGSRNHHPTVKPIALAKWLATLILPPPRTNGKPRRLLVPFSGSGSEMIGALRAGWDEVVGIELDPAFVEIAAHRLRRWEEVGSHIEPDELERAGEADARQVSLFAKLGS